MKKKSRKKGEDTKGKERLTVGTAQAEESQHSPKMSAGSEQFQVVTVPVLVTFPIWPNYM